MLPTIQISSLLHFGFVVPYKTGIVFQNQVGGLLCAVGKCEGFFLPFEPDGNCSSCPIEFKKRILNHIYDKYGEHCYGGIDHEDADVIDLAFKTLNYRNISFTVDRERLKGFSEAWIGLHVDHSNDKVYPLFDAMKVEYAYLTWPNSD